MRLIIIHAAVLAAYFMSSQDSVHTLYSEHHGWLHNWLRSKLGNAADAADLAQATFVRLLQRRDQLQLNTPRAFLRTVARGLVIDHWRREELARAYCEALSHCRKRRHLRQKLASCFWNCSSALRACSMV